MKRLSLLMMIFLLQGCESQSYLSKDEKTQELTTTLLEIREGLAYLPKSTELFTGKFIYYCASKKSDPLLSLAFISEEVAVYSGRQDEKDGLKGTDKTFKDKSVCIEENYLNGKRNGLATTLSNESKVISNFKDGVLHGLKQSICIKDGNKEEECGSINYKDGIESGIYKSYNDKGQYYVGINLGNTSEADIKAATKNLDEDKDKIENLSLYDDIASLYHKGTGISAYIGKSDNSIRLRYIFKYEAKDWLFVKSIIIAADNERFEKKDVTFKRDNDSRGVREWYDILALDEDMKILKAIINSKETTIRFKGNTSYDDYIVTAKEKASLKNVVDAYEALLAASS